jgi:HCOMODA/2-hydroxy-3-carboxy-muconic semialdehyde decarboxylase
VPPDPHRLIRLAARAAGRHGLAHAYGHVSLRIDEGTFLVSPPQPLGTVLPGQEGTLVPLDGALPPSVLGEVRIHREIYRRRADVGGICRVQPPSVTALSALGETPRPLHGLGTYFAPRPPLWDDPALIRSDEAASAVAEHLGGAAAVVLRGNGAVTVGASPEEATCRAFFLEDAARIELALLPARAGPNPPLPYSSDEVRARAIAAGGIYERMWQFLCFGDPEWQSSDPFKPG